MKLVVPRETEPSERRVAATPESVRRLTEKLGFEVWVEAGAGSRAEITDDALAEAGAKITADRQALFDGAKVVLKVLAPRELEDGTHELDLMPEGCLLVSLLFPSQNEALIEKIAERKVNAIALDKIPRISRAQKMDVLSSMANIAGYRAIVEAAAVYGGFFSGQITAAGKTPPARVLIIGAGVAGLAAIAAAKALGAVVYAFDTREVVKEQVESLGAKFLVLDYEESGEGKGGYAKVMSKEFIEAEMALFAEQATKTNIVVTTALIPGKPAPLLWKEEHVQLMPTGGVVVDMAASQGGNCQVTMPGESIVAHGVHVIGYTDLACRLPTHASTFFANNLVHLLTDMGGAEDFRIDLEDEVVRGSLQTHDGEVLPPPPPPEPSPVPKIGSAEKPPDPPESEKKVHKSPMASLGVAMALTAVTLLLGWAAPGAFIQHFTVFILACFIGWQVIWNVTPALHTPLMSVTNAISGIILIGGVLQAGAGGYGLAAVLGGVAILVAAINVAGGFLVTQRMLAMFHR